MNLQDFNLVCIKNSLISRFAFNSAVFLIILNNTLYHTKYQFSQIFFVGSLLFLMFMYLVTSNIRPNKFFYLILAFIFFSLFFSVVYNYKNETYINRSLYNSAISVVFTIIFFTASGVAISIFFLYLFLAIFVFGGIYLILTSDRNSFNPNWYSMTLFYLFSLSSLRRKSQFIPIMAIMFGIYGSRGALLSVFISFIAFMMPAFLKKRHIISVGFLLLNFGMFCLIYYLYSKNVSVIGEVLPILKNTRALGGREGALLEGFSKLVESDYLGYGIGANTTYRCNSQKGVHVHFGLLDIFLRFGIAGIIFICIFIERIISLSRKDYLPYVLGGLFTVLYYNGLATSHVGINCMLYLLLGRAIPKRHLRAK